MVILLWTIDGCLLASHSADFKQVKNLVIILLTLKKSNKIDRVLINSQILAANKNSFWRNSVTYRTPCHAVGHFVFWCHHVTYRTPCHTSDHLVIYSIHDFAVILLWWWISVFMIRLNNYSCYNVFNKKNNNTFDLIVLKM